MNAVLNESTARILNVTQDQYYADPCVVPSLSQSMAHTLLSESALHAWSRHPRLGKQSGASTKATDEGTLMHKLILGVGADIEIIVANDFRGKDAQRSRDFAIEMGKLPVLEHKYAECMATAQIIRDKFAAKGIVFDGKSEVAIEWSEHGEHGPVLCRGMLDHVKFDQGVIYDFKKIRSANPRVCGKHMIEYGYDIQNAAYKSAVAKLYPELRGRIDMLFLFAEMEAPYDVVVARPNGVLRELGEQRWSNAVFAWERCLRTNKWPGYADSIIELEAPSWAVNQEMGEMNAN